jgi:5-methylthioribose kinase
LELAEASVAEYVQRRGHLPPGPASVQELGGGVSSRVFLVASSGRRLIVKQPLGRFRVREEWLVGVDRVAIEARFLAEVAGRLPRGALPELIGFDEENGVLIESAAPANFVPWKQKLLVGEVDLRLAQQAGELAGRIHALGFEQPGLLQTFDQPRLFDEQRIDPYLRHVAKRHPGLAALGELVRHLETDRTTLIHGDFSPKNMLTDGSGLMLVDHEVATWNDPLFDVCFFLNHLVLKGVHREEAAPLFEEAARAFLAAYTSRAPPSARRHLEAPSHLLPALLLARVDGKSPVEYLTEPARGRTREAAVRALRKPARPTLAYVAELLRG